jgi:hypothetical protein
MSGTADTNWRSYVGPQDNGLTVDTVEWQAPLDPENYDDLVKGSNVSNLCVSGLTIPASQEDSIDFVRGRDYVVQHCIVQGSITAKGSIDGLSLYGCSISGTIELGQYDNYWTKGRAPTRNVSIISCTSPDGSPIRVKLWDAEMPFIESTNVKVTRIPRWVWLPYFLFRRLTNPKAS